MMIPPRYGVGKTLLIYLCWLLVVLVVISTTVYVLPSCHREACSSPVRVYPQNASPQIVIHSFVHSCVLPTPQHTLVSQHACMTYVQRTIAATAITISSTGRLRYVVSYRDLTTRRPLGRRHYSAYSSLSARPSPSARHAPSR